MVRPCLSACTDTSREAHNRETLSSFLFLAQSALLPDSPSPLCLSSCAFVSALRRLTLSLTAASFTSPEDSKQQDEPQQQQQLSCWVVCCRLTEEASRSLMEMHDQETLREAVRSLGAHAPPPGAPASAMLLHKAKSQTLLCSSPGRPSKQAETDTPAAADGGAAAGQNSRPEDLIFSPLSPLRCVRDSFPLEDFCAAGEARGGPASGVLLWLAFNKFH